MTGTGTLPLHIPEQQPVSPLVVQSPAAVAGGIDPGRSVQGVHAEAGVVGYGRETALFADRLRFQKGVFRKGGPRLLHIHLDTKLGLEDDLYPQLAQNSLHLFQFALVLAGQYKFHLTPPQAPCFAVQSAHGSPWRRA